MSGHANVFWFVLAWGAAAAVGAAFGPLQARVMPSLAGATEWLVRHRDLGPRYLAENTGGNAADTLRSYGVSSILGLAAVGYIQAANVLMGPFKIIFFGMSLITIPEAARLLRRSPRQLPLFCAAVSVGLTLLALAWGAVLLVALPRGLGHLMLGSIWRPTYPLVLPTTLPVMAGCATTGALIGLHALGAARRSLRAVIITLGARCTLCPRGSRRPEARSARCAMPQPHRGSARWCPGGSSGGRCTSRVPSPFPGWLWPRRHPQSSAANHTEATAVLETATRKR